MQPPDRAHRPIVVERTATSPARDVAACSEAVTFVLHPPADTEIAYETDRFVTLLPFSSGACDLTLGGGPVFRTRVRAGSVMLSQPGTALRVRQFEPMEFLALVIEPGHVTQVAERSAAGRVWHTRTVTDLVDAGIAAIAQEIRRSLLADPLVEPVYLGILADAVVARLICRLVDEHEQASGRETLSPALLRRLVQTIDAGLAGSLSVTELARLAGLSRSHFSRAFQAMTGDPPQRFILKRRLCRARDLLGARELGLAEVAAKAGFSSQAHLSTAFRQHLGVTPGMYRAAIRG